MVYLTHILATITCNPYVAVCTVACWFCNHSRGVLSTKYEYKVTDFTVIISGNRLMPTLSLNYNCFCTKKGILFSNFIFASI